MSKKINLVLGQGNKIDGLENIDINDLNKIFSCSIDMIYCSILNAFNPDNVNDILTLIIDKLKPQGQLLLIVQNIRGLAEKFLDGAISDQDFFSMVKSINNSTGYKDIITYCMQNQNSIIVTDVKKEELVSFVTLTKNRI